jgi:hypothetical protein
MAPSSRLAAEASMGQRAITVALGLLLSSVAAPVWSQKVPVGSEFQVNTTPYYNGYGGVSLAGDAAGNFLVVWSGGDGYGLRVQRFDSTGAPLGSEFQVGTDRNGYYGHAVSTDADGDFVIVWHGYGPGEGYSGGVFGQRFDSSGAAQGGEFLVNTYTTGYQGKYGNLDVASDSAGNFVVVWDNFGTGDEYDIFGRRYASDGTPLGGEFQVNPNDAEPFAPRVASDSAGNFVVVWTEGFHPPDVSYGVFGRRFDSSGNAQGNDFLVNSYTTGDQGTYGGPDVAADADGNFVVVWHGDGPGAYSSYYGYAFDEGIFGRRFDSSGNAVGGDFLVNTTAEVLYLGDEALRVDSNATGDFVVVWTAEPFLEQDAYSEVFAQQFDSNGVPSGGEFRVNTYTVDDQGNGLLQLDGAAVAVDSDGDFVVVWQGDGPSGYQGIFGQRFGDLPPGQPLAGTRLQVTNKLPDNPEKNRGKWTAKDESVLMGEPEGADDPRCNGDPAGTVKASIRFFSDGSAGSTADTGEIPLPCEFWLPIPPNLTPSGYKYKDRLRAAGPCKSVQIKDGKRVKASCGGKKGVTTFPYDLVPGTDQGMVNIVLTTGSVRYCSSIDDFNGKDGSDGKKFQGKNAPAPAQCAVAP